MDDGFEVHPVPEGSLVVLRNIDVGDDEILDTLRRTLVERAGHDRLVVLCVPSDGLVTVVGGEDIRGELERIYGAAEVQRMFAPRIHAVEDLPVTPPGSLGGGARAGGGSSTFLSQPPAGQPSEVLS